MSQGWPTEPGQQPPVTGGGSPPVRGGPAPTPPPLVPPATPASSSWPPAGAPGTTVTGTLPGAEPPGPGGPAGRRTALIVVLVVLIALMSSLATYLLVTDDGGGDDTQTADSAAAEPTDEADDPTEPSTEASQDPGSAPSTTAPSTGPAATEEEVIAEVRELQAYVEEQRGLEFQEDVEVELLDDAAFEARLLEVLEKDLADIEHQDRILSALGLIEGDEDLLAASEKLLGQGVLGFYETEMNELVVRGTALTPYTRQTMVHELVHALDDQVFELYRPQYEEADDEVEVGFSAVLEGNARRIEEAWLGTLSEAELDERDREEALYALNADLSEIPWVLIELLSSPYEDGRLLVDELVAVGGEDAVDAAIVEPPTTTEQVLVPEAFLSGEGRVEVAPPPADGEIIDQGVFGMLLLKLMLEDSGLPSDAFAAVDGWAGDWYVAWQPDEETTCLRADIVMDTPTDAEDLLLSLEDYTDENPTVSVEALDDTTVRLDACTPPPAGGGGGGSKT